MCCLPTVSREKAPFAAFPSANAELNIWTECEAVSKENPQVSPPVAHGASNRDRWGALEDCFPLSGLAELIGNRLTRLRRSPTDRTAVRADVGSMCDARDPTAGRARKSSCDSIRRQSWP